MAISDQNEQGMTFVWAVLVFGPFAPFYEYVAADSKEEAIQLVERMYPTQQISSWVDRDVEMEQESREIVEHALEEAAYDAMLAVSKRKNGRI